MSQNTLPRAVYLNNQHPRTRLAKKTLIDLAQRVLEGEGRAGELSITLVDDETMTRLNSLYHYCEGTTDVLSFPLQEGAGDLWGDIYISLDEARRQANEYGGNLTQEVCLLVVHGILHLCGYDDQKEPARSAMRKREADYLECSSSSS
ncbi:MAG: rRNA maturation RNase YbeY [bacterium]|jgi:rRNA maturation RNase YbeY